MTRAIRAAAIGFFLAAASLSGEVVTLSAAASLQGGNPFFSDVRVFNTSYDASLEVTATYRCFIPTAIADCPASPPVIHFPLAPRQSRAFDDMVANPNAFDAHDTAGGVEFETPGPDGQLVVTSRLYSTFPQNTVGMFIPGLRAGRAYAESVLTSIRHDPLTGISAGFRTNVGAFNPGNVDALAQFSIFDAGEQLAPPLTRTVPAHAGLQISGIFEAAGLPNVATKNATIVILANVPLFTYAAVLDNRTADPIFVQGAPNRSGAPVTPSATQTVNGATKTPTFPGPSPTKTKTLPPMGGTATPTRTATRTPTAPGPSATPTQPGPSATPTPTVPGPTVTATVTAAAATSTRTPTRTRTPTPTPLPNQVNVGGGLMYSPQTITISAGETVNWVWVGGFHSTTSDTGIWDSGAHSPPFTFSHTFNTQGTFPYHCTVHGLGMNGTVQVN